MSLNKLIREMIGSCHMHDDNLFSSPEQVRRRIFYFNFMIFFIECACFWISNFLIDIYFGKKSCIFFLYLYFLINFFKSFEGRYLFVNCWNWKHLPFLPMSMFILVAFLNNKDSTIMIIIISIISNALSNHKEEMPIL